MQRTLIFVEQSYRPSIQPYQPYLIINKVNKVGDQGLILVTKVRVPAVIMVIPEYSGLRFAFDCIE